MARLWVITMSCVLVVAAAAAWADQLSIKDEDGKTLGVLVICNDCKSGAGSKEQCHDGAEAGWLGDKPCGECLLKANAGTVLQYPYDLHVAGKLTDPAGNPVKQRFVKMFMANGWGVRTRTGDDGTFRLMLGATAERKSKNPLVTDVGTRVDSIKGNDPEFALYLMPESYKPCAATAAPKAEEHKKSGKKK